MNELACDVAVIGGGPAGLAAAAAAREQGAAKVTVVERDSALGGILQQCIHPGFGLSYYNEELCGPEYAARFIDRAREAGADFLLNTSVLELTRDGQILCVGAAEGVARLSARSVVLAMGCRERTRGNIAIPGSRPAGVYTAGTAQRLLNRQNRMVGKKIVILGSGDIGMIMARRLTLEGAEVAAVIEIMDYPAGLTRNRVQCLDDFGIPLLLSHTVTGITGRGRVEGVYVAAVDENRRPIPESQVFYPCDTLLLSVGLIPENELSRGAGIDLDPVTGGPVVNQYMQTSASCVFACGNVVHVNDLVDNVTVESETAGRWAARYALGEFPAERARVPSVAGENIRYVCPQQISLGAEDREVTLYFRVRQPQRSVTLQATAGDGTVLERRKLIKANPGEMEHVTVRNGDLNAASRCVRVDVLPSPAAEGTEAMQNE